MNYNPYTMADARYTTAEGATRDVRVRLEIDIYTGEDPKELWLEGEGLHDSRIYCPEWGGGSWVIEKDGCRLEVSEEAMGTALGILNDGGDARTRA